jgi:hypothetical protein
MAKRYIILPEDVYNSMRTNTRERKAVLFGDVVGASVIDYLRWVASPVGPFSARQPKHASKFLALLMENNVPQSALGRGRNTMKRPSNHKEATKWVKLYK